MLYLILIIIVILLLYLIWKQADDQRRQVQFQEEEADRLSDQLSYQLEVANKNLLLEQSKQLQELQRDLYQQLLSIRETLGQHLTEHRDRSDQRLEMMTKQLTDAVKLMQDSNEKRLEEMRVTVEEKLDKTLHSRLQASFATVSQQLESVNQGLGEMKTVARDVGTLNKVLSNTKTRGILGELQLGQIIEDIMSPSQYEVEVPTVSGSRERVEYAIKLPGQSQGQTIYLPIDSKFPLEDYYRLEDAYERGQKEEIELHRKMLLAAIKRFAKDINKKYLNPPETTNFGIMFLPTEGLYAEVVRHPAFFDSLRRDDRIVIAGPSTLSALLNSLSVGFKTLSLQRSANDIGRALGQIKTEFGKFEGLLTKTQTQLNRASQNIDSLLSTRTKAILRSLDRLEQVEQDDSFLPNLEIEENHEN